MTIRPLTPEQLAALEARQKAEIEAGKALAQMILEKRAEAAAAVREVEDGDYHQYIWGTDPESE